LSPTTNEKQFPKQKEQSILTFIEGKEIAKERKEKTSMDQTTIVHKVASKVNDLTLQPDPPVSSDLTSIRSKMYKPEPITQNPIPFDLSQTCLTILYAEDDTVNQQIIKMRLHKFNHNVTVCQNGLECVELFKLHRKEYDVILMDVQVSQEKKFKLF
jgi:PleD family two-component response regulator